MFNPQSSFAESFFRSAAAAAKGFAVDVVASRVRDFREIETALTAMASEPAPALIAVPDGFLSSHRRQIVELAARLRLPGIYSTIAFAADGGLMAYAADQNDSYRRAAGYIDRILRGEKPADLPVQQPVKFELVINMKTAKALGLTVPLTLQVAADKVIE